MKLKKYQITVGVIAVYALCMAFYFGLDLLREGKGLRFWVTLTVEIIMIVLAFFALKKRDEFREQRKRDTLKNDNQ